jgi:cytochrome c oxidase subunit 2
MMAGCTAVTPNTFAPQGPAAARITSLTWLLIGLGGFVYLAVMGVMVFAFFRSRFGPTSNAWWTQNARYFIIIGGAIIPAIVLLIVYGFTLHSLSALNIPETELTIEVIGHQWWWEVQYPEQQIITANEIHIPTDQPVKVVLTSEDVIHSFWVPELNGKLDLVPGRTNEFWLQADKDGQYWGLCAELCGVQHAKMLFVVVAQPEASFNEWLVQQQEPAVPTTESRLQQGQIVFQEAGCATCHTIRGTDADGTLGPDLTHFASRLTLGAGAALNGRGQLAGWIIDPHGLKPGNLMPAANLSSEELHALLDYLESLE